MEDSEKDKEKGGWLGCLLPILVLTFIAFLTVQYGIPYYSAHLKKNPIVAVPTAVPEPPTPVPIPTVVPTPTPTPSPTPTPTPTPKPTVWTPPPPDRTYPNEWISATDGTKYENVKVLFVEPDRVTVTCDQGTVIIQISTLGADIRKQLNYDSDLAGETAAKRDLDRINEALKNGAK